MPKYHTIVLKFIFILNITFGQNALASAPKEPLYADLGKTMGFVMGQDFAFEKIKTLYPELLIQTKRAELDFSSTFGAATKNIESELKKILDKKYNELITTLENELETTLDSQKITRDIADNFLVTVHSRASGEIHSPIIETLLHYQYIKHPSRELSEGFRSKYRTGTHPKAKGLDFQIDYPRSWTKKDGNRPNIIQLFKSNNGHGYALAMIMTKDFVDDAQGELTAQEIATIKTLEGSNELAAEMFSSKSLKAMAEGAGLINVRNITSEKMVLDRWPAAVIEFTGEQQRLDFTITMYNKMYLVIYKNYLISIQCMIGKSLDDTEEDLKTKIIKFTPLFRLIANSLVIQSQYQ